MAEREGGEICDRLIVAQIQDMGVAAGPGRLET